MLCNFVSKQLLKDNGGHCKSVGCAAGCRAACRHQSWGTPHPQCGDLSTLHEQVNSTTANHLDGVELYSRVPGQGSMVGRFHFASDFDKLEGSLRNLRGCFWTFWQQEVGLCWKQKATFPNGKTKMNAFGGSITSYHS